MSNVEEPFFLVVWARLPPPLPLSSAAQFSAPFSLLKFQMAIESI